MSASVLIILTSHAQLGNSGKPTGLWAEELAVPYYGLVDAGVKVELTSTAGGQVPIDPGSVKPIGSNHALVDRMLEDPTLKQALRSTLPVETYVDRTFDAILFPGGHGTMWDLPESVGVQQIVEKTFASGKLIASVCHGAAGLVSAKRPDGVAIVFGQPIAAFTDSEEAAAGLTGIVPFMLEARLRALGALFEGSPNWQSQVVAGPQFITGQNPQSSAALTTALITALKA